MSKRRDTRYDVWVNEGLFNDGRWYPVPRWGCGNRRKNARQALVEYSQKAGMTWTLNASGDKPSRCVRTFRYVRVDPKRRRK